MRGVVYYLRVMHTYEVWRNVAIYMLDLLHLKKMAISLDFKLKWFKKTLHIDLLLNIIGLFNTGEITFRCVKQCKF